MTPELLALLGSIAGGTGALLSYWAGWRARGAQRPPRGSYGRCLDPDWRRSFNHENTNRPSGPPPLNLRRSEPVRMDEGRTMRGNGNGGPITPPPGLAMHFRGVPLIPPLDCTDPQSWIAEQIYQMGAELAQPEPEGVIDDELLRTYGIAKRDYCYEGPSDDWPKRAERAATIHGLRAVLARCARHTLQPVPVSERPWEREGWCDAEGRCYGWDGDYWWMVGNPGAANETITHCLPHWALPVPGAEVGQ